MAKLRHIAIAAQDPDAMAEFYKKRSISKRSAKPTARSPMATI